MFETIILENGGWGAMKKIILTNTHLNFYRKEGWFSSKWVISSQIPLEEIEESYVATEGRLVQNSQVKLRLKNGVIHDLALTLSDGDNVGLMFGADEGVELAVRTKKLCVRWVNAINQELGKNAKSEMDALKESVFQLENPYE